MGKVSRMNRLFVSLFAVVVVALPGGGVAHGGMIPWTGKGEGSGLGVSTTNFGNLPSTDPRNRPGDDVPLSSGIQFSGLGTQPYPGSAAAFLVNLSAFNEGPDSPETISFDRAPYIVSLH